MISKFVTQMISVSSLCLSLATIGFGVASVNAGENAGAESIPKDSVASATVKNDSVKVKPPQKWALVPAIISTAETGVQGAVLVIRYLNSGDTINLPSYAGFALRVSQKQQVEINLFQEAYMAHNLYHLVSTLNFISWPAYFYGIGNHTDIIKDSADFYTSQGTSGDITFEKQILPHFFIGPQALFNYESIDTDAKHGLLTNKVTGYNGAFTDGAGGVATYDRRDAIYWTRRGAYLRAKAAWYREFMGSNQDFDNYSFEARQFFPMGKNGALGFSGNLQLEYGDIPFRQLSTASGDKAMRGLIRGKYRDRDLLVFQSEYKDYFPDWNFLSAKWIRNRLGYAVFAETGQVAHDIDQIAFDQFLPDFGLGLRYAMNPANRMNLRLDIGFVDSHAALAINYKEAF